MTYKIVLFGKSLVSRPSVDQFTFASLVTCHQTRPQDTYFDGGDLFVLSLLLVLGERLLTVDRFKGETFYLLANLLDGVAGVDENDFMAV